MSEPQDIQKPYEELLRENEQLRKRLDSYEASKKAKWSFRWWVSKRAVEFFVGFGLKMSMVKLYNELPDKVQKETLADVSTHIIWRLTRIGVFAILAALIPISILVTQTVILYRQNLLIDKQNTRLDQQTNLAEATRRGSLVFLMSNILDKMDEELKDPENKERKLSKELIGRIVALNEGLKPYLYLENDTLIASPLSPERGQLLLTLVKSGLDSLTLRKIYSSTSFTEADLIDVNLDSADLQGAKLQYSNLCDAKLQKANLRFADLMVADMWQADLQGADLQGAKLQGANLEAANLGAANLEGADMSLVNLGVTNLREANLRGADLVEADLWAANLEGADLSGAKLQWAEVDRVDWIEKLKEWNVKGADVIGAKYYVEKATQKKNGFIYYIIKKRK